MNIRVSRAVLSKESSYPVYISKEFSLDLIPVVGMHFYDLIFQGGIKIIEVILDANENKYCVLLEEDNSLFDQSKAVFDKALKNFAESYQWTSNN